MSGLDMLSHNYRSRQYAPYVPTDFGNVASTRFISTAYESPDSLLNIPANVDIMREINKRNNEIKKRFETDNPYSLIDVSDIDEKYSNPSAEGRIQANKLKLDRLDQYIKEQRQADPDRWEGIKTKEEIDAPMIERAREARRIADDIAARAEDGMARIGGTLAGGFGGAMTGVINLATLPLGFGAGMGILRAMASEGVLNAAIETSQIPMRKEWMDTLGHKYGLTEMAADVAFAGVGAAGLTGVIRGGIKGVKAWNERGSRGMEIMSDMSDNMTVPKDGRDALKYQSRIAHIDEEIPVTNATRQDVAVHRQNVNEAQQAFEENRAPVYQEFEGAEQLNRVPDSMMPKWDQAERIKRVFETQEVPLKKEQSLIDFIRKRGGVNDPTGELRDFLKTGSRGNAMPGLITKKQGDQYQPDKLIRDAAEAGFFARDSEGIPSDLTSADLFNALDLELRGIGRAKQAISAKDELRASGFDENMSIGEIFDSLVNRENDFRMGGDPDVFDQPFPSRLIDDAFPDERGGIAAMRATVEAAEQSSPAFEADFARLLKDQPNLEVDVDGQSMTLREISEQINEDRNLLQAMKVCAIG